MAIWNILHPFVLSCGHLVQFVVICYIVSRFGMLYKEKSGNPGLKAMMVFSRTSGTSGSYSCSITHKRAFPITGASL
jgi:hypothetical protein